MTSRFISTHEHQTHNPKRSQTYTVNFFNTAITTTVTCTPAIARNWVYSLRNTHRHSLSNSDLVVGLGVQWKPAFNSYYRPSANILQLCVGRECLIFQLNFTDSLPATLRNLLLDDRVTFVGVHNGRDRNMLEESRLELRVENLVDLARAEGFGNRSMEDMCCKVLGFHGIVKPREIAMSDWDEAWLTDDQVQYACVDAYIACSLGVKLGYPKNDDDVDSSDDDMDSSDDDGQGHNDYVYTIF